MADSVNDIVRVPEFDRRKPYTETVDRHTNEEDRKIGNLQQGPRSGERIPDRFNPGVDYTNTDAPGTGPVRRNQ